MKENKVLPQSDNEGEITDIDPLVKDFLKAYTGFEGNPERLSKLNDIQSDYDELERYSESGDTSGFKDVRPGTIYKLLRVFDIDAKDLPKCKPVDERQTLTHLSTVDAAKTQIWEDGGMQDVWDDVRNRFKAEGTAIVQLGYDKENDGYIPLECCELAECYFDASKQYLASDSRRLGKCIKVFIRSVKISWGEFITLYPDFADKVNPGSPSVEENRDVFNSTQESRVEEGDMVTIHFAYSIEDGKNPVMAVYAGGNSVLLDKAEGKKYPFWIKRSNGKEYPFLPFVDAHVSNVKRGFYSPSVIGLVKDKIEALRKVFFYSFPVFEKSVNPILLLMGTKDERLLEEMSIAREMQSLGQSYIIPTSENVQMGEVKPQPIFGEVEQARVMLLREISSTFGFNVQELEEVEQTATEFVGKTKAELKAIAGLYKSNSYFFEKLAEYSVALAARYWKTGDKRLITFQDDDFEEGDIEMGTAVLELKEFTGTFKVETDLKMPLSTQDKRTANQSLLGMINALLATSAQMSKEAIEMQVEAIEFEASLSDMDHIYTRSKLNKMFLSQPVPIDMQTPNLGQPQATEIPEDMAAELAPMTFLKESGLSV